MVNLGLISTIAKEKNIKMNELAQKLGISNQALFQIIRNNSTKVSTLEAIADALEVSPVVFFGAEDNQSEGKEMLKIRIQSLEMINEAMQVQIDALTKTNKMLNELLDKCQH